MYWSIAPSINPLYPDFQAQIRSVNVQVLNLPILQKTQFAVDNGLKPPYKIP